MARADRNTVKQAKQMLAQGVPPEEVIAATGCGKSSVMKWLKNDSYLAEEKARLMIHEGKGPLSIQVATGLNLDRIKAMIRNEKKDIDTAEPLTTSKESAIHEPMVTTRMMNSEEIERYGVPEKPLAASPKSISLTVGPVAVELAEAEVKEFTKMVKDLGFKEVVITFETTTKREVNQ